MIRPPFALSSIGYKPSLENPCLFVHPDGAPYFPILLKEDVIYNEGEVQQLVVKAAYEGGYQKGSLDSLRS